MAARLSEHDLQGLGFEWPKYAVIEATSVVEDGKIDLTRTIERLRSRRSHYQEQLNAAFAFKMQTGADCSDFTDRFDDYARMRRDLDTAIAYLEQIIEAMSGKGA
jgi:hypothetical protein